MRPRWVGIGEHPERGQVLRGCEPGRRETTAAARRAEAELEGAAAEAPAMKCAEVAAAIAAVVGSPHIQVHRGDVGPLGADDRAERELVGTDVAVHGRVLTLVR